MPRAAWAREPGMERFLRRYLARERELATAPIALAEVQGYVYAAYSSVADVQRGWEHGSVASRPRRAAAALRKAFSRDFWLEPERTVALALRRR